MSHKLIRKEDALVYDQMVSNYLKNQNGSFFLVTNDEMFVKTVRGAMRFIGFNYDSLAVAHASADIVKKCRDLLVSYAQIVLFIEARIGGSSNVYEFKRLKDSFGDKVKIICLTPEVSEEHVSFIAENEVDSIIVKPISINNLIQKIAFAIRPTNSFFVEIENIRRLIEQGRHDEAMPKIELLLAEKPGSSICMMLKGDIFKDRKEYVTAENFYREASKASRLNLKPLQRLASLYAETGDSLKYLKQLLAMDKISPLNHSRKISIGENYCRNGEEDLAQKYFDEAIGIVSVQANDMLASTYMEIGVKLREVNPERGLEFMRQALEAKGSDFSRADLWMVNEMGLSLRKQGDWRGAVDAYQKALEVIPDEPGLHYNMGMAYFQGKEHLKALKQFEKAVAASPGILQESPLIPFNIGMVHYQMRKFQEAEHYMRAALDNDPDFEQAKAVLARLVSAPATSGRPDAQS
jgi:tetratricopeptide (TPR) repeat protein